MKSKRIQPYLAPLIMLGFFGYSFYIGLRDMKGLQSPLGITIMAFWSLLILLIFMSLVTSFKNNRQNSRALYQAYPELKKMPMRQIDFTYRNVLWKLYLYENHLISRRNDFKVVDLRNVDDISLGYHIQRYRNSTEKVYHLMIESHGKNTERPVRIKLQASDYVSVEEEMKRFFAAIETRFPHINLRDQRFEGKRSSDYLANPWTLGHWSSTVISLFFLLVALSPFQRQTWDFNDRLTLLICGSISFLALSFSIKKITANLANDRLLRDRYPELVGQNLTRVTDFAIPDLRVYLYQDLFFQQVDSLKLVDLNQVHEIAYQVLETAGKNRYTYSHYLVFLDDKQEKLFRCHLQTHDRSYQFIYKDKVKELLAFISKYYPAIRITWEDNIEKE